MKYFSLLLVLTLLIPSMVTAQDVRINEVMYSDRADRIELKNFESSSVDVSNWSLCSDFVYHAIGAELAVISGNLNIPPGGILALGNKNLDDSAADLGLYTEVGSTTDFGDPNFLVDYVQWGSSSQEREDVAVGAEEWTAGDFVATVAAGSSIEYDSGGNSSGDWTEQPNPTIGSDNGNVTSVNDDIVGVPNEFSLAQNYPNPFNPSTFIQYTIPQTANLTTTRLEIFNMLGQRVRILVNEKLSAGTYSVGWNGISDSGEAVASGVYLYRLSVGEFVDMKKMLMLK